MTSLVTPTVDKFSNGTQVAPSSYCTLQWRRGQLLVKTPGKILLPYMPALEKEELLVDCLKHSPIDLVKIDHKIGYTKIQFWANASEQACKSIYLNIPSASKIGDGNWLLRSLQRITDLAVSLFLLPILLLVMFLYHSRMLFNSSEPLFYPEWYVGKRGKLFRVLKFRAGVVKTENPNTAWRLFSLDNLLLLLNVLRGEISLVGRPCLPLKKATLLNTEGLTQLNRIPGIFSILNDVYELDNTSNLLHLDSQTL